VFEARGSRALRAFSSLVPRALCFSPGSRWTLCQDLVRDLVSKEERSSTTGCENDTVAFVGVGTSKELAQKNAQRGRRRP